MNLHKNLFVSLICIFFISVVQLDTIAQDLDPPAVQDTLDLQAKKYQEIKVDFSKSKDQAWAIQLALNKAKVSKIPSKIIIEEGTYLLNRPLRVYSNTWLKTSPKTKFVRNHHHSMLLNGDYGGFYNGYNGNSNIIIDGGIWDAKGSKIKKDGSAFAISHANHVLIQNVTVKDIYYSHAIDLAGDQNVVIRDSKFIGFFDDGTRGYAEAIQIDVTQSKNSFSEFGSYDSTPTKNVRIENNYFGNSSTLGAKPWGVGVGSHSAVYGEQYENIEIVQNRFEGMTMSGIKAFNWNNVIIHKNEISSKLFSVFVSNPSIGVYTKDKYGIQRNATQPAYNFSIRENAIHLKDNQSSVSFMFKGQNHAKLYNISIVDNSFYHLKPGHKRATWTNAENVFFGENPIQCLSRPGI
jgi:predicted heme/steroid binding protein